MLKRLLLATLAALVLAAGGSALWDLGYARQLRDLHDTAMVAVDPAAVQRNDPIAVAAIQTAQGPPQRRAAMDQLARVVPPWWKRGLHQQLLASLRHWQELEAEVIIARTFPSEAEARRQLNQLADADLQAMAATLPILPDKGDLRQFVIETYFEMVVVPSFARLPDYERARAESELLFRRAAGVLFLL